MFECTGVNREASYVAPEGVPVTPSSGGRPCLEDVQAVPESHIAWQQNTDLRVRALEQGLLSLSLLEQRFSKFEQRFSKVEEVALQHVEQSENDSQRPSQGEPQSSAEGDQDESERKRRSSTVSNVAIRHMEYAWKPSIWDMAVFIFSEQMKFGESLVVIACLMFTLFLQTAFILQVSLLINDKLSRFDDTSQQEYTFWRTTAAHDMNYRNKITDASLATIVCNGRLYAPVSSLQLQIVRDLQDYLAETGYFGLPAGALMMALAMCVWYLAILHEFRTIYDLLSASFNLKVGPKTTFERHMDDDETCHIVAMSHMRRFFLSMLITLRLVIVCILGWQGTFFLLSEVDLEAMILNSVALQMMLIFDDMIYELVPSIPQATVKRMQPLRMYSSMRCKCWHEWGLFMWVVFLIAAMGFLVSHSYTNIIGDLRDSYDALCGGVEGSYDFVVAVDAIGIPWAAATTPISDNVQEAYVQRAMATARTFSFQSRPLQSSQRSNLGSFMQVASSQELEQMVSKSPEFYDPTEWSMAYPEESVDIVGWKNEILVLGQRDFADEPKTVYNHYLSYLLKQTDNVGCAQVPVSSCTQPGRKAEHVVMRKLCPTHCGCASPKEGTVANTYGRSSRSNFTGCAAWNTRTKTFVDTLQDLPCADTGSRDDFVSWSAGVGDAEHNASRDHLVSVFDSGKCPDVVKIRLNGLRLCQETSLPSICPESCGCRTSGQEWNDSYTNRYDFCPYSCYGSQPPCITVAAKKRTNPRGPHAGFACIFPFKFQGVTYHSCTSKAHDTNWCAVTLLDGVSHFWGDCPDTSACVNRST